MPLLTELVTFQITRCYKDSAPTGAGHGIDCIEPGAPTNHQSPITNHLSPLTPTSEYSRLLNRSQALPFPYGCPSDASSRPRLSCALRL